MYLNLKFQSLGIANSKYSLRNWQGMGESEFSIQHRAPLRPYRPLRTLRFCMAGVPSTIGGFEVGLVLICILFGICTVQTALYFARYPGDPRITKILVMILWTLQGVQIILMVRTFYLDVCSPLIAGSNQWTNKIWESLGFIISGLVQVFYTARIYRLRPSLSLMVTLSVLVLLKFVIGFMNVFWALNEKTFDPGKRIWVPILWMVDDVVVDLLIAFCMSHSLAKHRTRFESTNSIINHMIVYAVSTGLVTSVLCIVALVSFLVFSYNWLSTMLNVMDICMYFFAMLANLHTRAELKKLIHGVEDMPIPLTTVGETHAPPSLSHASLALTASGAFQAEEPDRKKLPSISDSKSS